MHPMRVFRINYIPFVDYELADLSHTGRPLRLIMGYNQAREQGPASPAYSFYLKLL